MDDRKNPHAQGNRSQTQKTCAVSGFLSGDCSRSMQLVWKVSNCADHNPPFLYQPYDVTFADENIVVAESFWPSSRLQVFSDKGRLLRKIGDGHVLPFGVTVNSQGNIVFTDHNVRTVRVFETSGVELFSWKSALFEWPTGVAVDQSGRYYICDWSLGMMNIHEESGERVRQFKTGGSNNSFSCPAYVALDEHRRIIVSDAFDRNVKIFDESGRLLQRIEQGNDKGKIVDPRGVCTDGQSNVIVADWDSSQVKLYSPEGRFIRDLLTTEDGIQYPRGLAANESNLLVITEQKLNANPSLKLFA